MIEIAQAIQALDSNSQFVVTGSPSNEAEDKANVKFVSGADENGTAIFKDTQDFTWEQVSAKQSELQADYDAKEYQRQRKAEFDKISIGDQLDMHYHDTMNGTSIWTDWVSEIKNKFPK